MYSINHFTTGNCYDNILPYEHGALLTSSTKETFIQYFRENLKQFHEKMSRTGSNTILCISLKCDLHEILKRPFHYKMSIIILNQSRIQDFKNVFESRIANYISIT